MTGEIVLRKGVPEDWKSMYENVWSRPECARYMFWNRTENEEDAKARMMRTIRFQKEHDAWTAALKETDEAVGFAGVALMCDGTAEECGICIGPDWQNRGYGKQILCGLMRYAKEELNAHTFVYRSREENTASRRLAESLGFKEFERSEMTDERNGERYIQIGYRKEI